MPGFGRMLAWPLNFLEHGCGTTHQQADTPISGPEIKCAVLEALGCDVSTWSMATRRHPNVKFYDKRRPLKSKLGPVILGGTPSCSNLPVGSLRLVPSPVRGPGITRGRIINQCPNRPAIPRKSAIPNTNDRALYASDDFLVQEIAL